MRKLVYSAALCGLILLAQGCGERSADTSCVEYNLNQSRPGEIQNVFADVELVPLEFAGDYYPHGVGALHIADSVIAIVDTRNSVHLFKADGSFLSCSDSKIGEGPDEFTVVMGSAVNPYDSTIEILTPDRLNKYDMQFNPVGSTAVPTKIGKSGLMFQRMYDLSDSLHILSPTKISSHPYRIFRFNSNSGELTEVQSYEDDVQIEFTMQEYCCTCDGDGSLLFLPPCFTEYIYKMDDATGRIERYIHLIPADSFICKKDIASLGSAKEQQSSGVFTLNKEVPVQLAISANRIFLLTLAGPSIREMKYYVISRDSGNVETFPMFTDDRQAFPLIQYVDSNFAYAVMEKFRIEDSAASLLLNDGLRQQLEAIDDPESLVMLKYRIK